MLPPGRLEEPWAPAGLRELSSSNLRRGSAPLEIALQRGVSLGAALWPPSCGSGLEWLQVLDAGVCEGTVTEEGPGWKLSLLVENQAVPVPVVRESGQGQSPSRTPVLMGVSWADQHLAQSQSIYQRCK